MKKFILLSLMGAFIFASCKKDEEDENTNNPNTGASAYTFVAKDTTTSDEIVSVYTKNADYFDVGYNTLFLKVEDLSGDPIENANLTINPMMDMGSMQHSSPKEQPVFKSDSKYYEGVVVFTMNSNMGSWTLNIEVNGESVLLPVEVVSTPSNTKYVAVEQGTNGKNYTISLVRPNNWEVGMNDFSILVNKKLSMMDFPPEEGLSIAFDPEMTSMGHGSPNNIDPADVGDGYYKGKVNYTMTGDWRLNLYLLESGDTIVETYLDIKF